MAFEPGRFNVDKFYLTVDVIIFTIKQNQLSILLVKRNHPPFEDKYALPGGFASLNEETEDAAIRVLKEKTGLKNVVLKQLNAYGKIDRDPRGRVITIPYFALVNLESIQKSEADWFSVYDEMPKLAFDHNQIVNDALDYLKSEIQKTNIAFQIMPKKFTLTELQQNYEAVLNKKFDKRNFRKKIRELKLLLDLHETAMEGAHRPAKLYSCRNQKYYRFV